MRPLGCDPTAKELILCRQSGPKIGLCCVVSSIHASAAMNRDTPNSASCLSGALFIANSYIVVNIIVVVGLAENPAGWTTFVDIQYSNGRCTV